MFSLSLKGQIYQPVDTLHNKTAELEAYFDSKTEMLVANFKELPSYNKKVVKDFSKKRSELAEGIAEGSYLLFDDEVENYVNQLLQQLAIKNNINEAGLRIFVSRETSPNALSLGDGTFIITISLLNKLATEGELNFVLAHELAHYQLQHLEKDMDKKMAFLKSSEYKEQKKQTRGKYNKFSKSIGFIKEFKHESMKESRQKEFEADSLGYLLFSNVTSAKQEALSALKKLDSTYLQEYYPLSLEVFQSHFTTPNQAFDETWTVGFDFSSYNYKRGKIDIFGFHKDSLKSHPEIENRVQKLQQNFPELRSKNTFALVEIPFQEKRKLEAIFAYYCANEYGKGIYNILQLQEEGLLSPVEDNFSKHMLYLFYDGLYKAKRNYRFKKYVDEVDVTKYTDEYNLFLTILDKMRSSELKEMATKYESYR